MRLVTKSDFDFSKAGLYRKVTLLPKEYVRCAEKEERIVTFHSDGKETENVARVGDYIISATDSDDAYVMTSDRFRQVYLECPDNPSVYRNIEIRPMLMVLEDVYFTAPWGSRMNVLAGGMIAEEGDVIYGVDRFSFIKNFGRVAQGNANDVFCLLNEPLHVQLHKAEHADEENHVADIRLRIEHVDLFGKGAL